MLEQKQSNLVVSSAKSGLARSTSPAAARREVIVDSLAQISWRRRGVVAKTSAICTILAALYLLIASPLYTSTATLLLQRSAPKFLRDGQAQAAIPDNDDFLYTQQQVITSTPVLAAALGAPGVLEARALQGHHDALTILKKQVAVEVGKKDQLISVSFDATDPAEATRVVNAVVDAYTRFQTGVRHTTSSSMLTVLRDEKVARDEELAQKSQELLQFSQTSGLGPEDGKSNVVQQRLDALAQALSTARIETVTAQSSFDEIARDLQADPAREQKFEAYMKSSASMLSSAGDDAMIRQQIVSLQTREEDLRQRFMANNPAILAIHKRIDDLDIAYAASLQHRLDSAKIHEADLQKSFDDEQQASFKQEAQRAEYSRLHNEVAGLEKLVDTLDTRMKEVSLTEDGGVPSVTILEPARASDSPTHPDKARTLLIALFGGLCLGCALAVGQEWRNGPSLAARDASSDLGMPIIGELPPLSARITPAAGKQKILADSTANVMQACQALHESLEALGIQGRGMTVLVTSPGAGAGKSVLASNLAIALAESGKRVLLVDADLRSPSQGRIFNISGNAGLCTLLEEEGAPLLTAVYHTDTPWLDVMLSGTLHRNPSEILNGQKFIDLLGDLSERYDYVLLDSPPVMSFNDARTIAASCDATLLVVRSGKINRKLLDQAREGLLNVGANIAGVILNADVDGSEPAAWDRDARESADATGSGTGAQRNPLSRTMRNVAAAVERMK